MLRAEDASDAGGGAQPLVSIVTPFFNTAPYLADCIESVLRQSYRNFEYILVDNCSTDGSSEIAARYAVTCPRIRVVRNSDFLAQIENYNSALTQISDRSKYCKIVQADDWIFPDCIRAMVEVAEKSSQIGIVGAYSLCGTFLLGQGLEVSQEIVSGRAAARKQMLEDRFFLGSQTTVMYRASIVRLRRPFYPLGRYHPDTEAAYEILKDWDLGFVHQVLSYLRIVDGSISNRRRSYAPLLLDRVIVLRRFGRDFLSEDEYAEALGASERKLMQFLGASLLKGREAALWQYHAGGYSQLGLRFPWLRVLVSAASQVLDLGLNPKSTVERAIESLRRSRR